MPVIQWNPAFSVNISNIDNQHKKIVELINNLHDQMKEGKGKESISTILNDLTVYTAHHFKTEEDLFHQFNYPDSEAHILEHKNLVQQVMQFKSDFANGRTVLTNDVMNFLKDWLSRHIAGSDKSYSAFLNSRGVV